MKNFNNKTKIIKIFIFSSIFLFLANIQITLAACGWASVYSPPADRETASDDKCTETKPTAAFGDWYSCFCDKQTQPTPSAATKTTKPKIVIPYLQIKIPNVIFTEADITCTGEGKDRTCQSNFIGKYIVGIYKYALGVIGIVAVIVMMIGGVMWIMAGGNASRVTEAKAWIGASITGLLLMLSSYTILSIINPDLVNFKALSVQQTEEVPTVLNGSESKIGQLTSGLATNEANLQNIKGVVPYSYAKDPRLTMETIEGLKRAAEIAKSQGVELVVYSAHRSLEYQQKLFDAAVKKYGSEEAASVYVSRPSYNAPHVTGRAVDICINGSCQTIGQGASANLSTPKIKQLQSIMKEAGWVRYCNEWWHFEYKSGRTNNAC